MNVRTRLPQSPWRAQAWLAPVFEAHPVRFETREKRIDLRLRFERRVDVSPHRLPRVHLGHLARAPRRDQSLLETLEVSTALRVEELPAHVRRLLDLCGVACGLEERLEPAELVWIGEALGGADECFELGLSFI